MIDGMVYALKLAQMHASAMEQEIAKLRDENAALRKEQEEWAASATSAGLKGKPDLRPVKP